MLQVTRLEGQVTRYKAASENSEKVEDELKAEKRKLQREVQWPNSSAFNILLVCTYNKMNGLLNFAILLHGSYDLHWTRLKSWSLVTATSQKGWRR